MFRPDFGYTRSIPRSPAGHSGRAMLAALQVEDSLVSPIVSAKPCFVKGVFDIRYDVPESLYYFAIGGSSAEEFIQRRVSD